MKGSTLNVLVLTTCADYMAKYNLKNDAVSIDKVNPWKKTIKEEPVSEGEKKKFLAVALNDSRVKEVLKGRDFNVSMVKYVMLCICCMPESCRSRLCAYDIQGGFRNIQGYRVIFSVLGKLEVVRVEKIV